MPCLLTAPWISTWMRRLDRSSTWSFCTTGITNTEAPMTTFWPDRSVAIEPSAPSTDRPLRPVTMNASLGPATLIRERTNMAIRRTRRTAPMIAMSRGVMILPSGDDARAARDRAASRPGRWSAGYRDHEDLGTERERLVRPRVELDLLAGDREAHLAVAAGRYRRDHHAHRADQVGAGERRVGATCSSRRRPACRRATRWAPRPGARPGSRPAVWSRRGPAPARRRSRRRSRTHQGSRRSRATTVRCRRPRHCHGRGRGRRGRGRPGRGPGAADRCAGVPGVRVRRGSGRRPQATEAAAGGRSLQ